MTVKELIKELEQCNPDDLVVMSTDEEGNGFDTLVDVESNNVYVPKDREIHIKKLTKALRSQGYTKEDLYEGDDAVDCVVLWP